MKVIMVLIIISALGTVTKRWIKGLEDLKIKGRVETIQTTALLRSAKIEYWEESYRFNETCSHTDSSEKPEANVGVKNSQICEMIFIKIQVLWRVTYSQPSIETHKQASKLNYFSYSASRSPFHYTIIIICFVHNSIYVDIFIHRHQHLSLFLNILLHMSGLSENADQSYERDDRQR